MGTSENNLSQLNWTEPPMELYTGGNFNQDFSMNKEHKIAPISSEDLSQLGHEVLLKNIFYERIILPNLRRRLDWSKISMGLAPHAFKAIKESAIDQIAAAGSEISMKVFADFDGRNRSKVKIHCNNTLDALLLQNLFRTPSRKELSIFDKEDYVIYVALDPNIINNNQKTVNIDVSAREIVILSGQYLETMDLGIFFVLNQLLFNMK